MMGNDAYGQPQDQQSQQQQGAPCPHRVMRLQVFQQGVHAQCFQCGAMAMYPNGMRETGVLARGRVCLDEALRQMHAAQERQHIAQPGYGRPADPSLPLAAQMRRAPGNGWWSR